MIGLMPPSDKRFEELPPALQSVLVAALGMGTLVGGMFLIIALMGVI